MSKGQDAKLPTEMALTHVDLLRALSFAADKHVGQKRKGAAQEPYLNHLVDVAHILSETAAGGDIALLMAALLHDTIEDQAVTAEEIEAAFGADVRDLVVAATDQKGLLKVERKRLQVENAPHKTPRASLLKTADKTSNLRSIACSPPDGWSADRMADYVSWAQDVVSGLLDGGKVFDVPHEAEARAQLRALFDEGVTTALKAVAACRAGEGVAASP